MSEVDLQIVVSENFSGSDRLRSALEAVTEAYERSMQGDPEVEGHMLPTGGSILKPPAGKYGPKQPLSADGCWGYSTDNDGGFCGWYSGGGDSCVMMSW